MPEPLDPDLDADEFWVCEKHDRWNICGYPCPACEHDWRVAHPERAAYIERFVMGVFK